MIALIFNIGSSKLCKVLQSLVASKPVSYLIENFEDKISCDKALVQKGVGRF